MSRIGRLPITVPGGVSVEEKGRKVTVKGPKGTLELTLRPEMDLKLEGQELHVQPNGSGAPREARAFHGLTRALLNNMVQGVTTGYEKALEIQGVGWNAQAQGKNLVLNIGFCHPVNMEVPAGLEAETPKPTSILIRGADKQAVGQFAASVRAKRPPEPYKGKGIRYVGEQVRRKVGKAGAA